MSSKTMLCGLNIFVLLAIVAGGHESSIIFEDNPIKLTLDKITPINQTIQRQNIVQPIKNHVPLQTYSQPIPDYLISNIETKKEMWILGLFNAALNIDKSLDSLNMHNPLSDHNIVVSPLCIVAAMALVLLGSRGETKLEINKLFNFSGDTLLSTDNNYQNYKELGDLFNYFERNNSSLGTQVNLAKAIFVQNDYNISKNYILSATEYLYSELITVNFKLNGLQAQQTINQYVKSTVIHILFN